MSSSWTSSEVDIDFNSSPLISSLHAGADGVSSASTSDTSAFTLSSGQRSFAIQKPLDPEDERFLFKYLDKVVNAAHNISLMNELVPVHHGRPGQHILRWHPWTGDLYACIPSNPYAPKNQTGQNEYSLPSYDSYIQSKQLPAGRRYQEPYPSTGNSPSLMTCNHCLTPTKVLNNDNLCPFHAFYIATGRFLGYYEFCALVEMEKNGLSVASGWWTIEDMVEFADALSVRILKWRFIQESTDVPQGSWISKASPFGAIGSLVPQKSKGKTAVELGVQQILARSTGRASDELSMGPRLARAYKTVTGFSRR
jgi:hypothetical protein